jgi:hypothetical protein
MKVFPSLRQASLSPISVSPSRTEWRRAPNRRNACDEEGCSACFIKIEINLAPHTPAPPRIDCDWRIKAGDWRVRSVHRGRGAECGPLEPESGSNTDSSVSRGFRVFQLPRAIGMQEGISHLGVKPPAFILPEMMEDVSGDPALVLGGPHGSGMELRIGQ